MKFLIDECLSPALVNEAHATGSEAYHLAHIGRAGSSDRRIAAYAIARDLILVTNNASDFRRVYATQDLHPGLVILIPDTGRETQILCRIRAAAQNLNAVHLRLASARARHYRRGSIRSKEEPP